MRYWTCAVISPFIFLESARDGREAIASSPSGGIKKRCEFVCFPLVGFSGDSL